MSHSDPLVKCAMLGCETKTSSWEDCGFCPSCWASMSRPERRRVKREQTKAWDRERRGGVWEPAIAPRWNGERCRALKVRVVVGKPDRPTWWFAGLEGTERRAVRVDYGGQTFYLDNEDGSGWAKVTVGRGAPQWGHKSLNIEREVG